MSNKQTEQDQALFPEIALSARQAKPEKPIKITPHMWRIADAAADIEEREAEDSEKAFITRYLVQATLPYRNPKGDPPIWFRKNGRFTLSIQPGYASCPGDDYPICLGYPYGSVPRLLMFWLTTEVVRSGNKRITLGNTLADFMKSLGLNPRNGGPKSRGSDRGRLQNQMERLFEAKISFEYLGQEGRDRLNMQVGTKTRYWWDFRKPGQLAFWESWVELGEEFYQAITESPFPLDMRALRVLKNSPLALDFYAWTSYKTFQVNRNNKPQRVSWHQLHAQLGTGNDNVKSFKQEAKKALRKVLPVYPGLRLEEVDGGLIVRPGLTAIQGRKF